MIIDSMKTTGGTGFKIPDSGAAIGKRAGQSPFDLFGTVVINGIKHPAYIEAKWNKTAAAFSTKRIEPHQNEWLSQFVDVPGAIVLLALGVHEDRGKTRAYLFDWSRLKPKYDAEYSFHWKELETLPFNLVKKGLFDFKEII